jgi:hypothetical protein
MEYLTATPARAAAEEAPDWWPYSSEFPHWYVWRGVAGLVYARRVRSSPPIVFRGIDALDLRDQIRQADISR